MSEKDQEEQQNENESSFTSKLSEFTGKGKNSGSKKKTRGKKKTEENPEGEKAPSEVEPSVDSQDGATATDSSDTETSSDPNAPSEELQQEAQQETDPEVSEAEEDKEDGVSCEQGKSAIRTFKQYAADMAPTASQTSDSVVRHQRRLRNALRVLLKTPANEFEATLKAILQVVRDERQRAFADRFLFRGFDNLNLNKEESKFFRLMLRLIIASADTTDPRKAADVVDMAKVYNVIGNDAQQQKLQNFYER